MKRRLVLGIGVAMLAAAAAALAWLLVPRHAQREQLIEAAWAEERANDLRPTHVAEPLSGSFGELLEPHLAALHEGLDDYKRLGKDGMERVARIYKGQESIALLGPEMSLSLELHRDALHGTLRATHARSARAPTSLQLFAVLRPGAPFPDVQHASRLASLEMLTLLEHGRAGEAAEECADVLALSRDLSYPSVLARMIGIAVIGVSSHACGRALSAAPATALERVRPQLIAIRAATPRFADILARERLFGQLELADPDPRLPGGARTLIQDTRDQNLLMSGPLVRALFLETAAGRMAERMAAYIDAQRFDWPACVERMEEATRRFEWNPIVRLDTGFVTLLRWHRDGLLKLDALTCATTVSLARTRTGTPLRDAASACPAIEPQAKCGEQAAPLHILDDAVSVTLSDGSDYTVPLAASQGSTGVVAGHR